MTTTNDTKQPQLSVVVPLLDEEGNLLNFTRIGMRRRMDVAASAAAESGA